MKYLRAQLVRSVRAVVGDTTDTRLLEETYTLEEVQEVVGALEEAVLAEIETEMINCTHTNVLILQQLFSQAQKWHLNLNMDLSEVENRYICWCNDQGFLF